MRVPDQSGQAHGATVDEGNTPPPAEHAEHRVVRGDAQVAPQRELEPARDRVALDRRDHRFGKQHPGRAHRTVAVVGDRVAASLADRFEVGARAEHAVRAGQDRDRALVVGLEGAKRLGEQRRGRPVDGVTRGGGRSMVTIVTGPSCSMMTCRSLMPKFVSPEGVRAR